MIKLFLALCSLLFLAQFGVAQIALDECYDSDIRLRNNMESSEDIGNGQIVEYITGVLDICLNGTYASVCNDTDIDPLEVARIACQYMGYYETPDFYAAFGRNSDTVINQIDCPEYVYSFSECAIDGFDSSECPFNDDLYVVCSRITTSPSYCYEELSVNFMSGASFNLNNGARYSVGFPVVCLNNTWTPYCLSDYEGQQSLANQYCDDEGVGIVGPLLGMASEYELSYSATESVSYLTCLNMSDISTCDFALDDTCPFESFNLITCVFENTCSTSELYPVNDINLYFPSSRRSQTSRIETCNENGERIDLCDDGTIEEASIIQFICPQQGFSTGRLATYEEFYESSSSGMYAVDIECGPDAYSFSECYYNVSDSCVGTPLIVMCYEDCRNGEVRLYNSQTSVNNNESVVITGVLQLCIENQWVAFCDDGEEVNPDTIALLDNACNSMGYSGGELLDPDSATYNFSQSSLYLVNVDCPPNSEDFSYCSYNISNEDICIVQRNEYLLQCTTGTNDQTCYSGSNTLNSNFYVRYPNGTSYMAGYFEICGADSEYGVVCSDIVGDEEAQFLCASNGYPSGYPGTRFGSEVDFRPLLREQGVYGYTCPDYTTYLGDCQFNFTDGIGCTENGGPGLITCEQEENTCYGGFRLSQSGYGYLPNNRQFYVGNAEVCINGTYSPICRDLLTNDLARLVCQNTMGSNNIAYTYPIIGERSDYDFNRPTSDMGVYDLDCTFDEYGYCDYDTAEFTMSGGCMNYGGHSIITCEELSSDPTPSDDCDYTGQVRLASGFSDSTFTTGVLEICVNGTYLRVCGNDSYSQVDIDELAGFACSALGYPANSISSVYLSYYPSSNFRVIDDVMCPDYTSDLAFCNFETTDMGDCASHSHDLFVSCSNFVIPEVPDCIIDGQVRINNNVTNIQSNYSEISGVLEICVNGSFYQVCGNGDADVDVSTVIDQACREIGYTDGSNYTLSYPSSSSVIDYASCPDSLLISLIQCEFSTTDSGSCVDMNSFSRIDITCRREIGCNDGAIRLSNQISIGGLGFGNGISGFLEICVNGTYSSVCANDTFSSFDPDTLVRVTCSQLGYPSQQFPFFNPSFSQLTSVSVVDNIDCPMDATDFSDCSIDTTSMGECSTHEYDAIVQCYSGNIPPAPACMDGDIQFYNNYTNTLNRDNEYVTEFNGVLEICYNGTYHGVCYGTYDEQEVAETVCSSLGYTGNTTISTGSNYDQYYKNSINDISCPDDFTSLSQCSFSLSNSSNSDCIYHYNDLFITCTNSVPKCLGSLYQLSNQSFFTFSNNTQVYTGRLEVCLNGARVPVCASAISDYQLDDVCRSVLYDDDYFALPGQYIGSINDYQTGTSSAVVHSLSCPSDAVIIDSCQYNTTYGCQNNEEVLTCIRHYNFGMDRCYESNIRLGNNSEVYLPYSTSFYTGRVEICSNGEYVDVCNNTQEAQYFANRSCDYFYSGSIATIIPYDMDYSTAESGGSYSANNCSDIRYNGVGGCSNTTTNSSCAYSPLSVRCERECRNYGDLRLQETTTTNYDNGTASVSGILQFCESSTWSTVCENNFTDTNINQFCSNFGYTNGSLLMSNPGGDLSTPASYVNLTCSDDYYYCSVEYGDDDVCEAEVSLYCYNAVISDNCYEGQTRLGEYNNQQTYASGMFNNQTSFRIGYVEVCIDGSFHLVCNDNLDVETVSSICYNSVGYRLGYPGALYGSDSDYLLPGSSNGVYDISCPSNDYFSLYDCAYSTVSNSSNGCDLNGGPALVTCIDIRDDFNEPSCGGSRLADRGYGTFSNGTSFSVGRPEICVNSSTYAPICGSLTQEEAVVFCSSSTGDYGALTSPAFGTSYDYAMNNEATTVISDLYCSQDDFYSFYINSCNQTVSTSIDGCMSFEPEPLITCYNAPQPCREFSLTYDYVSSTSDTTFISPRYCTSESYAIVCRDGISDEVADLVCQQLGYSGGVVAEFYNYTAMYRGSTDQSLTNFMCNGSLEDCTYNVVDGCSDYEGDAVIACFINIPFCYPGEFALLDEFNYTYDGNPDFELITGYPALCVNNTFVPICDTAGGGLLEARIGCDVSTNFTFGFIGSPDFYSPPPLEYNGTLSVTNVSCNADGNCTNSTSRNACEDYTTITCGITCYENETRLFNQRIAYTEFGLLRVSGVPQVCADGGWITLCNDGTNYPDLPSVICQQDLGLRYGRLLSREEAQQYGPNPRGTLYFNNYVCPDVIEDYVEDCDANLTSCANEEDQIYAIECFQNEICIEGDIRLADSESITTKSGMEFTSGYPVVCVDDQLVPVCDNFDFGLFELTTVCQIAENITYGFPGRSENVYLPPLSDVNTSLIITNLSCNLYGLCSNTSISTGMGCDAYGGYAVVTCAVVCEDGDRRLYNERSYYTDDGLLRVTGTPQTCSSGGWVTICNDDSNNDNLPDLICQDSGYTGGYSLSSNRTLYGASGPGTFYISNVTCYGSVDNCSYQDNFSNECLSGDYDYVVQCYNYRNCLPGEVRLSDSSSVVTDEGFTYISGYPVLCVSDELLPLCNSTMPQLLELTYICQTSSNLTYGFPGTPDFLTLEPFSGSTEYFVTDFSCGLNYCSNTTTHTDAGCSLNGGYARITCANACMDDSYRLYNNMTVFTSDGLLRATGIPQRCDNGGWSSICTIGSVDPDIPNLICQNLGYANGVAVPYNSSIYGISPLGSFYLTNISCENTLESCSTEDVYNNQCLNGDLEYAIQCYDILASPTIVQQPQDVIILNSESTSFTCEFSGDPNPMIQWTFIPPSPFPPMVIMSNGPHSITTQTNESSITSTLTISSVSPANIGAYMCTANNGAPTPATGIANLQVIVPPTMNIAVTSGTLSLTEDDSLTLTCTESGALPHLPIVWTKGTTPVLSSSRISITSSPATQDPQTLLFSVESVLTISSAVLSDAGNYVCRTTIVPVLNEVVISTPLTVDVQVRNECTIEAPNGQLSPCVNGYCVDGTNSYFCVCFDGFTGMNCDQEVFVRSAPVFVTQPSEQRILLGDMANFSCIVTGEPQPSITWFKDGQVIPNEVTPYYIITTVAIANRGFYRCSASNSEGTVTSTDAPLFIANIAQYSADLIISEGARRKRQSTMIENELVDSARELAIGREIVDNVVIVALDAYLVDGQFQIIYTVRAPVTEDGRLNTTGVADGLNSFGYEVSTQIPSLSISPVMRFDGCLPEATVLFGSVQIDWPEIGAGETASLPCPCGDISDNTGLTASRMCVGDFISISSWSDPLTGQCIYDEYSRELCSAAANDDPARSAGVLSNVTQNANSFDEDTLGVAAAFLSDLADNEDLTTTVAVTLISAINNMASLPFTTLSNNYNAANEILNSFASIANNIPLIDGKAVVIQQTVAITAQEVTPENFTGLSFTVSTTTDGTLDDNSLSGEGQPTASVMAPDSLLNGIPNANRIAVGVLTDSTFFVQSETVQQTTPISVIVTFDVFSANGKETVSGLDPGITFTFTSSSSSGMCVFWDEASRQWSSDGCTTMSTSGSTVTCVCTHLSSFTIVPENQQPPAPTTSAPEEEEEYYAEPIIIVGAVISMLFILGAILSHALSSNQRYSQEGKIIISSHIVLFVLYIVLVLAVIATYTDSDGFCGTFSGLFHYMSLVYVMFIFTESFFYVIKLRHGIGGTQFTRYLLPILFIMSFGIPLVIVIASAGAGHDYYAIENAFCRPQSYPFYYGYIIPMGVIFAISVVCIVIGCMSSLLVPMKGAEISFRKQLLTPHLFAIAILSLIILIAWIFGMVGTDYGVVGTASTATQYIFGFMLMIHAVILLILTLLRTEDTRNVWKNCLNKFTGKSGKYDFAAEEIPRQKSGDAEAIGLGTSGQFSREGSVKKKKLTGEDAVPLSASPDGEEGEADTLFSSKAEEQNVLEEEERKRKKEEEIDRIESVISNPSTAGDDDDDEENKKTSL